MALDATTVRTPRSFVATARDAAIVSAIIAAVVRSIATVITTVIAAIATIIATIIATVTSIAIRVRVGDSAKQQEAQQGVGDESHRATIQRTQREFTVTT